MIQDSCPDCGSPRLRHKTSKDLRIRYAGEYYCMKCGSHFDTPNRVTYPLPTEIHEESLCESLGRRHASNILLAADSPITRSELTEDYNVPWGSTTRLLTTLISTGALAEAGAYPPERGGRQQSHFVRPADQLVLDFSGDELDAWWADDEPSD